MTNFTFNLIIIFGLLVNAKSTSALEITPVETGPLVKARSTIKIVDTVKPFLLAQKGQVTCGSNINIGRFRPNTRYASLRVSIYSSIRTKIKIRWDHPNIVKFPQKADRQTIEMPHQGSISNFYLRSLQPISGNIYFENEKRQVIATCPYQFLPEKQFSQSIDFSYSTTTYLDIDDHINSNKPKSYSINYSITPKSVIPEGGRWSANIGVTQNEGSSKSRNIRGSISYSW